MAQTLQQKEKHWTEKISRSGYFFGALLLHVIVFIMVATLVIFPAFHPPTDDFTKTYLPPSTPPPPPPPPSQPAVSVPTQVVSAPTTVITAPTATPTFSVPLPPITPTMNPADSQKMQQQIVSKPISISAERLGKIMATETTGWGRDKSNILESNSDPKNVIAHFPVYLASYADGDWGCNVGITDGKIDSGSLPNLVAKINEWSKGNIKGNVVPTALNIGGPDLMDKKPPFIFFTGHKDFTLTDQEVQNLRDYLQIGGCIWGDNTLAGKGSRFDVAFRREMKRVIPDLDKNFEPVLPTDDVFIKSWYPISAVPQGMNYYAEPLEHLDIDGKLAIFYTPNDYSDMFTMRIMPGDTVMHGWRHDVDSKGRVISPLVTSPLFLNNSSIFFRNYDLPSCLACQQLGMNIVGYLLVRFDKDLMLTP